VFVPGYAMAWLLDLFRFRRRTPLFRVALSIPLSIALTPVLVYLLGSLAIAATWVGFAVLAAAGLRRRPALPRVPRPIAVMAGLWIVIAVLSLVDLQFGNRLYYSTIGLDYSIRSAMIHSIATTGVPARSPFFFPGHPVTLRYHYFWLILCGIVKWLGHGAISGRQALIAGTPWCGIGLMGLVALYLRLFSAEGPLNLRRRLTAGIALLGVTGLDLIPMLFLLALYVTGATPMIFPSLEWWNEQVDGWIYTMLWEPHHLAGLIACLTGFLLLWRAPEEPGRRSLVKHSAAAGIAFATAAGTSIHVTFAFAIFLAVWMAITLWQKWRRDTAALLLAGGVAALLAIPYLRSIMGPGSGGPPLQFTVRKFMIPEYLMRAVGFGKPWQIAVGDLVLLPLNYFLELGVFAVIGWICWRFRKSRSDLAFAAMAAASIVTCTFLRSSIIGNNDLGWRGFLLAQFVLLVWGANLFARWPDVPRRGLLAGMIAVGAAGTLYDLAMLRVYPILSDHGAVRLIDWMTDDRRLGERTYSVRQAYEWVQRSRPANVVVQHDPAVASQDTPAGLYADRQAAASDLNCLCTFGGDPRECAPLAQRLKELYAAEPKPDSFEHACSALPVDILLAKDSDPVWKNRRSWVWNHEPIFANAHVRLFECRRSVAGGPGQGKPAAHP
jgi:hypothetical protein